VQIRIVGFHALDLETTGYKIPCKLEFTARMGNYTSLLERSEAKFQLGMTGRKQEPPKPLFMILEIGN